MTDDLDILRELVAALDHHAAAMKAADNGKPHWEDPINDFNHRLAFTRVGTAACSAKDALSRLLTRLAELEAKRAGAMGVVEAARRFALTCESNGFTGEGFDYNPEKLSALRAALASMPQEKA